jgi:hypothetical protein
MQVRRVVTGHDAAGKAVFAADEQVAPTTLALLPGMEFHRLWGADATVSFPGDGSPPAAVMYFPPVGGFRVGMFTVPPSTTQADLSTIDVPAALGELEAALPGMSSYMEPDAPGMHTTATVDVEYVISGRCVLPVGRAVPHGRGARRCASRGRAAALRPPPGGRTDAPDMAWRTNPWVASGPERTRGNPCPTAHWPASSPASSAGTTPTPHRTGQHPLVRRRAPRTSS